LDDLRLCDLHFLYWSFGDFDFYRGVVGDPGSGDFSGVYLAAFRVHEEQPIAFQVSDLRPLYTDRAVHVTQFDREHAGAEAFDFAGKAVPIFHHNHVSLFPREERHGKKKGA
jgi:hypothetical protein